MSSDLGETFNRMEFLASPGIQQSIQDRSVVYFILEDSEEVSYIAVKNSTDYFAAIFSGDVDHPQFTLSIPHVKANRISVDFYESNGTFSFPPSPLLSSLPLLSPLSSFLLPLSSLSPPLLPSPPLFASSSPLSSLSSPLFPSPSPPSFLLPPLLFPPFSSPFFLPSLSSCCFILPCLSLNLCF